MSAGRAGTAGVIAAAAAAIAVYAAQAGALVGYPWDWAPDDGLAIDYARRLVQGSPPLYARTSVPFPSAYTPLLPALLAPALSLPVPPLVAARLLAGAWTAALVLAVYVLVRQKASRRLAFACAALTLAPADLTFWFALPRVDGLMIALWLGAAAVALPREVARGAGPPLGWVRAAFGAVLLVGAVMAKPTAALHGAPLVAGWWLVDVPAARRFTAAVAGLGLLAVAALQWRTGGAFLWVMGLWAQHPRQPGLAGLITVLFLGLAALPLLFALVGLLLAVRAGGRGWRDGSILLVIGGLLAAPAMTKSGAWWNYLLPLYCALVVAGGRWWSRREPAGAALAAGLALALAVTRPFPLPSAEDGATARAFYGFVAARGAPILATRPDYAYVTVGQPVEAEGSGLPYLVARHVPGTERLLERIGRRDYRLVVATNDFWPADPVFERALAANYRIVGACDLGFFYGRTRFALLVPATESPLFDPRPGARCVAFR